MNTELISSARNERIRRLLLLQQKSQARRESGLFVVEGRRELSRCLAAGYQAAEVYYCPSSGCSRDFLASECHLDDALLTEVSPAVYSRIAYRDNTEGVVALVHTRPVTLSELHLGPSPLIVVLESVEKPGNIGAVMRSADAAGATAVIVCDPLTDIYNPNLIRASVGAFFAVPCIAASSQEAIAFLRDNGIQILTAQLQDSELYYATPMTQPTAIVMGTESTGLTEQWRQAADRHIRIPMLGIGDSLNVSVSAAILLFEAVRQRKLKSEE